MRGRLVGIGLVLTLLAGLVLFTTQTGTNAHDLPDSNGIVGAWLVTTFVEGANPALNMTSFYDDGNVLTSNSPAFPAATEGGAAEVRSAGHGSWTANDDGSVDVVFIVLRADTSGTFTGHRVIRGHFTVDSSTDTWSGPFTATVVDASGAEVAVVSGRAEATRISVETMGAVASPVAN